jgi:hypothetical protein
MIEDPDREEHEPADDPERSTAPQSPYTGRDVAVGAAIALVGAAVTFGIPLAVGP